MSGLYFLIGYAVLSVPIFYRINRRMTELEQRLLVLEIKSGVKRVGDDRRE